MRVLYLHGFASSAQSSKARTFTDRLSEYAITVQTPDFNQPSFETLTITRMIEQTTAALEESGAATDGPVVLIGSSLGAFVAVHAAARSRTGPARTAVDRLILLAPALDFGSSRMKELGEDAINEWRQSGRLHVFHYGYGRLMPVGYELYEDAARYDAFALDVSMPVLIFQGTRDTVVDPAVARRFAQDRPNVTLRLLEDDHQLLASMPAIWDESREFLGLPPRC
jgi:alpha-beta hydrolase superfamily lysophospholipase